MSFYTHDNVIDSPLNNFATLNPLAKPSTISLSNGNLNATSDNSGINTVLSTIGMTSGKWYAEYLITDKPSTGNADVGVFSKASGNPKDVGVDDGAKSCSIRYGANDGLIRQNNSNVVTTGIDWANGDIIRIFFDVDAGKIWFGKNNSWYNSANPSTGTNASYSINLDDNLYFFAFSDSSSTDSTGCSVNFGQDHTFGGTKTGGGAYTDANGIGQFYYEPPEGALALCTANIPSGPIDISNDDVPSDYMKAVTYTGNGGTQSIDVGFPVDLAWIKVRNAAGGHRWYDTVRGANQIIISNETSQERTFANELTGFNSNGFDLGNASINGSGGNFVAWCWKAAGTPADNQARIIDTDGSLITKSTADLKTETGASITPSKVSANRKSGFSILKYTGSGSAGATVPHGLSQPPELVITKNLDGTDSWLVSTQLVNDLFLNKAYQADAYNRVSGYSSSTISINNSTAHNGNNINYISYFWHSVAGYSKFGSYVGNGSADGPFIECGFRPAWVMVKNADRSDAHWLVYDNQRSEHNVINKILFPSSSAKENGEGTLNRDNVDFLSNGFKMKGDPAGGWSNHSGHNIIFAAFAEAPFNAPATAR